jgi:hypothetical protein
MSISSKLSPESNLVPYAKKAEDSIAVLRAKGLASEANQFEQILQRKISDKDPSIMDTFGQLDQIYGANLKTSKPAGEKEKVEELPADLAASIEDLAKKSQARNIALNPESLRDYADAALTGDNDTLARLYKEFDSEYKGALDIQQKEKKTLQRLEDGTQVLRGEQSGTMYSPAGLPLSVGDINTRVVNERLAGPIPELMQAQISGDVGVPYQPQVYEQPVQQAPSRAREAIALMQEAQNLYNAGKTKDALAIVQGLRIQSFMGGTANEGDLKAIFSTAEEVGKPETSETTRRPGESIDDWRKRTGR